MLHKFVHEVEDLPASEYFGWISFLQERNRKKEVADGNILAMEEDEMIERLTR